MTSLRSLWQCFKDRKRTMLYGRDKTIHRTGHLDIETDREGRVVSVWFRCMPLPFELTSVDWRRATEMRAMYEKRAAHRLVAVELFRDEESDAAE